METFRICSGVCCAIHLYSLKGRNNEPITEIGPMPWLCGFRIDYTDLLPVSFFRIVKIIIDYRYHNYPLECLIVLVENKL